MARRLSSERPWTTGHRSFAQITSRKFRTPQSPCSKGPTSGPLGSPPKIYAKELASDLNVSMWDKAWGRLCVSVLGSETSFMCEILPSFPKHPVRFPSPFSWGGNANHFWTYPIKGNNGVHFSFHDQTPHASILGHIRLPLQQQVWPGEHGVQKLGLLQGCQ